MVVLSDLLDPAGFEAGVRALLERRFDVHVLHLLDPEEMNPTLGGDLRLIDSETGEQRDLTVDGDAVRGYRDRLHQFLERVESFCRGREIGRIRLARDAKWSESDRRILSLVATSVTLAADGWIQRRESQDVQRATVFALARLAEKDALKARLVELRYFAGLTGDQAAAVLGISPSSADRQWVFARAWLRRELGFES